MGEWSLRSIVNIITLWYGARCLQAKYLCGRLNSKRIKVDEGNLEPPHYSPPANLENCLFTVARPRSIANG